MKEFDSLSIVYGAKSDNFIAKEFQVKFVRMPAEHPLESAAPVVDPGVNAVADQMQEANLLDDTPVPTTNGSAAAAPAPASDCVMDLLGFDAPAPGSCPGGFIWIVRAGSNRYPVWRRVSIEMGCCCRL